MNFQLIALSSNSKLTSAVDETHANAVHLETQPRFVVHRVDADTHNEKNNLISVSAKSEKDANPQGGGNLQTLQILRGVAALAVAFFHTNIILAMPQYGSINVFQTFASKGWIGVNFFFILSGFIILMAHQRDVGNPRQATRYLLRRGVRLYPIYWIMTTAFIIAAALREGYSGFSWDFGNLFTAYALLMVVDVPTLPLKVAWTLLFEIKFYLIFTLLILIGKPAIVLFVTWAAAVLVANLFFTPPDWGYLLPSWGLLNIWNINFLLGMVGFLLVSRMSERLWSVVLACGTIAMLYLAQNIDGMEGYVANPPLMIGIGLALTAVIVGCVLGERLYRPRFPKWCLYLGDASYSIYLVHSAVISLMAGINFKFALGLLPNGIVFVATFVISVIVGAIVHSVLEKPVLNYSRQALKRLFPSQAT